MYVDMFLLLSAPEMKFQPQPRTLNRTFLPPPFPQNINENPGFNTDVPPAFPRWLLPSCLRPKRRGWKLVGPEQTVHMIWNFTFGLLCTLTMPFAAIVFQKAQRGKGVVAVDSPAPGEGLGGSGNPYMLPQEDFFKRTRVVSMTRNARLRNSSPFAC